MAARDARNGTVNIACRLLAIAAVVLGVHGAAGAKRESIRVDVSTFTPGAPVKVNLQTAKPVELSVDVVPLSVDDVLAIRRGGDAVDLDAPRARPVKTVRDGVHQDQAKGLLHRLVIGALPRGYFLLAVHAGPDTGAELIDVTTVDAPLLARADASVVVPGRALRRGGTLRFEREGTGALYWSTAWTRYVRDASTAPSDAPFGIARTFGSADGNEWHVGDVVDVELTVTADEDAQFVAIEDPLPAGLAYQPRQHETGDDWSGLQFFDDRVVFFATRLSRNAPLRLHYRVRATTAGTFTAPPPTAFAMYGPPATAAGRPARITIR
ncbi:MAG TPA: hypothetical protein VIW69_17990 [Candidatus Elarobacter sp.]